MFQNISKVHVVRVGSPRHFQMRRGLWFKEGLWAGWLEPVGPLAHANV